MVLSCSTWHGTQHSVAAEWIPSDVLHHVQLIPDHRGHCLPAVYKPSTACTVPFSHDGPCSQGPHDAGARTTLPLVCTCISLSRCLLLPGETKAPPKRTNSNLPNKPLGSQGAAAGQQAPEPHHESQASPNYGGEGDPVSKQEGL